LTEVTSIQKISKTFYYNNDMLKIFDFNQMPLSKDIDQMSNNDTEKFNLNSELRESILKKENYYKLINYCSISKNDRFELFTVFGNYDYYSNILLVSCNIDRDSIIDYKIIASIMGDAEDMVQISTKFLDSINFEIITSKKRLNKNNSFELLSSKKE